MVRIRPTMVSSNTGEWQVTIESHAFDACSIDVLCIRLGEVRHARLAAAPWLTGTSSLHRVEFRSLAEIGKRLGRRALEEVAQIVRPETILGWHRKPIAKKFDGSRNRSSAGRAARGQPIEDQVSYRMLTDPNWVRLDQLTAGREPSLVTLPDTPRKEVATHDPAHPVCHPWPRSSDHGVHGTRREACG